MSASGRDFEIDLRLKAEFAEGQKRIRETQEGLAGVGKAAGDANKQLGAAGAAAGAFGAKGAQQFSQATKSAKELAFQARQLPMQFTDIATSLATGQRPLQVFLQQGGQLKDLFGGIGPAFRAMTSYVIGLINPLTVSAALVGTLGVAFFKGRGEIEAYDRALLVTGNTAGVTSGQIADMAARVGAATGEYGDASDAALRLAQSGKLTGTELEAATSAAVSLTKLTGESIETTTDKILKLAEAPGDQLVKLNEQYHFLSATVYEHVRALEDQGRTQEAAQVAVEEFARVHQARLEQAKAEAGELKGYWDRLGDSIASIWRGLKDLGRNDAEYRLRAAEESLARMRENYGAQVARGLLTPGQVAAQEKLVEDLKAEVEQRRATALARAGIQAAEDFSIKIADDARKKRKQDLADAQREWDQREIGDLDKKQKLEAKIAEIRAQGALLHKSDADIEAQIARARQRYQDSLGKPKQTDAEKADEAAQREIDNLQQQATLLGQLENGEKRVTQEARIRYEIQNGAYRLASDAHKAELIAAAQAQDAAVAAQQAQQEHKREVEDTTRAYDRLRAQLQTPIEAAAADVTAQIQLLNDAIRLGAEDAANYRAEIERISAAALSPAPRVGDMLSQFGIGDRDDGRLQQANVALQAWFDQQLAIIDAGRAAGKEANDVWDQREADARAQHFTAMTQLAIAQNQLQLSQASAIFGSMADIASSFAGEQTKTYQALFAISKGFAVAQAATALAVNVAEASKRGFPENLGYIAAAFAQGAQIAQIIAGANFAPQGYATGGEVSGPGTGTSDSIPAWLSDGEFVNRAAVVAQPGALDFLNDFNTRGMAALGDWGGRFRNLNMPAFRAPAAPRFNFADGGLALAGARGGNKLNVYLLYDEEQLRARLLNHPATDKYIVARVGENGGGIQAEWNGG
jgi:phage-related minor tail protein